MAVTTYSNYATINNNNDDNNNEARVFAAAGTADGAPPADSITARLSAIESWNSADMETQMSAQHLSRLTCVTTRTAETSAMEEERPELTSTTQVWSSMKTHTIYTHIYIYIILHIQTYVHVCFGRLWLRWKDKTRVLTQWVWLVAVVKAMMGTIVPGLTPH